MSDDAPLEPRPADVIYAAIHSAFIKYPNKGDGSVWDNHWIQPEQSKHLTEVVLLELTASGFEIIKKNP